MASESATDDAPTPHDLQGREGQELVSGGTTKGILLDAARFVDDGETHHSFAQPSPDRDSWKTRHRPHSVVANVLEWGGEWRDPPYDDATLPEWVGTEVDR